MRDADEEESEAGLLERETSEIGTLEGRQWMAR